MSEDEIVKQKHWERYADKFQASWICAERRVKILEKALKSIRAIVPTTEEYVEVHVLIQRALRGEER